MKRTGASIVMAMLGVVLGPSEAKVVRAQTSTAPSGCAVLPKAPPQPKTACKNKESSYACPPTEAALWATRSYCQSKSDGGSFDHVGMCYREVASAAGAGGQQCCYTNGLDNCTGSYDSASPYVMQKGAAVSTPSAPDTACGRSQLDTGAACKHCRQDVLPFCAQHCKKLTNGWYGSYYEDCGGAVSSAPGTQSANPSKWSAKTCGCGGGAANSAAAYGCTTASDYNSPSGH